MRIAWIDATNGASGDMLLGALLDAGADLAEVQAGLSTLGTEPMTLRPETVRRHGLRSLRVDVMVSDSATDRRLSDILDLLDRADLPPPARRFAVATISRLAGAEAAVHGIEVDRVHLHEVGALDSIADVVGCALALHSLKLLTDTRFAVSSIAVGAGTTSGAHGRLPLPAPAVLRLLADAGAPVERHPARMELCTPTGAALLAELADEWGDIASCTPLVLGTGAGTADPATHPNVLRLVVGTATGGVDDWAARDMVAIETTVDDLDPRLWPDVLEAVRTAGAADAWYAPVSMRKGRPGQVLTVLAGPAELDAVCRAVFCHTPTLGLRMHQVRRLSLRRDVVHVPCGDVQVAVKRGYLDGRVVTAQPEYEDLRTAAAATGRPVRDVLDSIRAAAEGGALVRKPTLGSVGNGGGHGVDRGGAGAGAR